jgi:hypothetical protein
MRARGVTLEQVERAVAIVNRRHRTSIYLPHPKPFGKRVTGVNFTLYLKHSKATFHRRSTTCRCASRAGRHRPHHCDGFVMPYVCWHGNKAVMMELFAMAPKMVLETKIITYRGIQDFEDRHRDTYHNPIGRGGVFGEACDCPHPENWPASRKYTIARGGYLMEEPYPGPQPVELSPDERWLDEHRGGSLPEPETLEVDASGADDAIVENLVSAPNIPEERWSDVNRKFNELFRPKAKEES